MEQIEQDLYCVGVKHRMNRDRRVVLAEVLARGPVPVELTREQENKYDENAIRVNVVGALPIEGVQPGHQLGYIGAETAEVLAAAIDAGSVVVLGAHLTSLHEITENHCKGILHVVLGKIEEGDSA